VRRSVSSSPHPLNELVRAMRRSSRAHFVPFHSCAVTRPHFAPKSIHSNRLRSAMVRFRAQSPRRETLASVLLMEWSKTQFPMHGWRAYLEYTADSLQLNSKSVTRNTRLCCWNRPRIPASPGTGGKFPSLFPLSNQRQSPSKFPVPLRRTARPAVSAPSARHAGRQNRRARA
jgi:hypothetical protein